MKHLLCWRREKALAVGGIDESLASVGPDDYDFPWCMAERGAVFKAIDEPLYVVRDHRECERLTTHLPLSVHKRDLRRILEKHGVERGSSAASRRRSRATSRSASTAIDSTAGSRWPAVTMPETVGGSPTAATDSHYGER